MAFEWARTAIRRLASSDSIKQNEEGGELQGRFVGRFGSARPIKQIEFKE